MPEDITKLDLMKLLQGLETQSPGVQVTIHGDVTINVHQIQNSDVSTTVSSETNNVNIDYSFIESLNLSPDGKKEAKGFFEKFTGTMKSYKDGSEGLSALLKDCAKYGPAALPLITEATKLLAEGFPG